MKRLIDSVQKIHQSEESKAALLDTLEKAQRTRHGKEHAVRWVAVAACLALTAVVAAVGISENKTPTEKLPVRSSENTESRIALRLESYRAGTPAQAMVLGEKQAAPADTSADNRIAYYAFRALNTSAYDRIYIGLRHTTATEELPASLFFGMEDGRSYTYVAQKITESDPNRLFETRGHMMIYLKPSESDDAVSDTAERIFRLGCPKNGTATYGIVAENDAEHTRTHLEIELTEKDGTVTAELRSQSISEMDGNAEFPSVPSKENIEVTAP